jgi:hypothetical protein
MARHYTVQYADPNGPYLLTDEAAWQLFSSTDHADIALADIEDASHHGTYAVRVLDGQDVAITGTVPR